MQKWLVIAGLLGAGCLLGCSDDSGGNDDSAILDIVTNDVGTNDLPDGQPPVPDKGPVGETGPQPDQAVLPDGLVDSGPLPDTAVPDTSVQPDAASLPACTGFVAGCTNNDYVDARNSLALRKVDWSVGSYKPKCLWIKPLQSVTFTGITIHPVTQYCGPEPNFTGGFGNTRVYKFTKLGKHGYEWGAGGSNIFRGSIKVSSF